MLGEVEVVLSPGEEGALGGHGDSLMRAAVGSAEPLLRWWWRTTTRHRGGRCCGSPRRRRCVSVVIKLTPGDVVAMGVCCGKMFLRFMELLRGVRRRQWPWLPTRRVDGAAEAEVWQRHGAWRRGGGAASGSLLWLWSGSAKP